MTDSYPPPEDQVLGRVTIDLDLPMSERWTTVAQAQAANIKTMIDQLITHFEIGPWGYVQEVLDEITGNEDAILARMPFGEEIRGIATAANVDLAEMIIFNLGYEIMGACTSVVAQDSSGHTYHARNLDFGLFMGHESINGTFQWTLADQLRQLTTLADFTRNGEVLYSAVVYVGYVGLVTGVRQGRVSVSVDSRFDDNYDKYLVSWLRGELDNAVLLSQMLREGVESDQTSQDFPTYVEHVAGSTLVGPAYAIIGGANKGEGVVITIGPNMTAPVDEWPIDQAYPLDAAPDDKFYVLETNYDHWDAPPHVDDRRTAAVDCMDNYVTASGVSKESLYDMLHASPNRNRLTTYTALMDCAEGTVEASNQYCWESDCVLW